MYLYFCSIYRAFEYTHDFTNRPGTNEESYRIPGTSVVRLPAGPSTSKPTTSIGVTGESEWQVTYHSDTQHNGVAPSWPSNDGGSAPTSEPVGTGEKALERTPLHLRSTESLPRREFRGNNVG